MAKSRARHVTNAALLIDASSSMSGLRQDAFDVFNRMVSHVENNATDPDSTLDLFRFADATHHVRTFWGGSSDWQIQPSEYHPSGNTALFDCVGAAIDKLEEYPRCRSPHATQGKLVMVVTDGQENVSVRWNAARLRQRIEALQRTGEWTFVFQVPRGYKQALCSQFGISPDNVAEWEQTRAGTYDMEQKTSGGIGTYYQDRAAGVTAKSNFFATTDLSKVKAKDVQRKLTDLSSHFKLYDVPQEWEVKAFVESKTRKNYVTGQAYYLLVKPEKVQADKALLLMEKGGKEVWGGVEARNLAGIPVGVECKVSPGNHAAYDVFVESRSHNRKLPRGSKVLIDVTQTAPRTPTWTPTTTT